MHAKGFLALNKERVMVSFEPQDEHTNDLLYWIEQEIGRVQAPYPVTKSHILKTIGFEKVAGIGSVTLGVDGAQDLLDLQLGRRKSVRVNVFRFHSVRFGIESPQPDVELFNADFSLPARHPGTIRVEFRTERSFRLTEPWFGHHYHPAIKACQRFACSATVSNWFSGRAKASASMLN
jgi:hypothetical protein